MAGRTRRHNRIAVRLGSLIESNSQNSSYLVAIADTLVLANTAPYYPDVMVYAQPKDDPRLVALCDRRGAIPPHRRDRPG
ncbi:MAG: hypothetical protein SFU83_03500 [Meiothermus sp.]|nr:hypothetical protein [Meiothermus sp.]